MRPALSAFLFAVLLALFAPGSNAGAEEPFVQPKDKDGPLVHRYSGFSFPAQVGRFHRLPPHQYDPAGRDVSVGYNLDFPSAAITVYVYPAGASSLEQEFARRQQEVTGAHGDAQLVSQGTTTVSPGKARALSADYNYSEKFAGATQPLRSTLLVARRGDNFVEYRVSYAASSAAVADKLVRQFTQELAWP